MKKIILVLSLMLLSSNVQAMKITDLDRYDAVICKYTSTSNGFYVERFAIVKRQGSDYDYLIDLDTRQTADLDYCYGVEKTLAYRTTSRLEGKK